MSTKYQNIIIKIGEHMNENQKIILLIIGVIIVGAIIIMFSGYVI